MQFNDRLRATDHDQFLLLRANSEVRGIRMGGAAVLTGKNKPNESNS